MGQDARFWIEDMRREREKKLEHLAKVAEAFLDGARAEGWTPALRGPRGQAFIDAVESLRQRKDSEP